MKGTEVLALALLVLCVLHAVSDGFPRWLVKSIQSLVLILAVVLVAYASREL
jgi:hypothetical protein